MINKLAQITVTLFLFLLPLFALPFPALSVDADKQIVLVVFSLFLSLLVIVKTLSTKKFTWVKTSVDLPILVFVLLYSLSTLLFTPNKLGFLTQPLGLLTIISTALLFFSLVQFLPSFNTKFPIFTPLIFSSSIVSLVLILQQFKLVTNFNPAGDLLTVFLLLLIVSVYLITKIISQRSVFDGLALTIVMVGGGLSGFHLATDAKPFLLPFPFGWVVMMESFKNFLTFLLGVGGGNFAYAFALGRPVSFNLTPLWNFLPNASSSYFLTLATEAGIITALSFLFLALKPFSFSQDPHYQNTSKPYLISLIIALLLQFLLPTNLILFTLTFLLLALAAPKEEGKPLTINNQPLTIFSSVVSLLLIFLILWQTKAYLANLSFRTSLNLANQEKLTEAYPLIFQAIDWDPYHENYRLLAGNLSLMMARNLSQNREATDSARNISFLTQQAVANSRASVQLNPGNAENWGQLAGVYQSMIGAVEGAEQSAVDAYNRQMALDPNNPIPKVEAAGMFLTLSQTNQGTASAQFLDQARTLLLSAINLKPDWNRTRYAMASFFRAIGRMEDAAAELQRTLDLTREDSQDYKQIKQELEQIQTFISKETSPSANTKKPPSPPPIPTR
jgi:hypothetical protein